MTRCVAILYFLSSIFFSLAAQADPTPVLFDLQQLTGQPFTNRYTLVVDATNNPYTDGSSLIGGGVYTFTPVNGTNIVGLLPAGYTLSVPGWTRTLHFVVNPGTNLVNVVSLITNGLTSFQPLTFGFSGTATNLDGDATNQVIALVQQYGGSGSGTNGPSLWTSSGSAIYPSGQTGTAGGWTSTGTTIYPQ